MRETVEERCSCGATFTYTGLTSGIAVRSFREGHLHDWPPQPPRSPQRERNPLRSRPPTGQG